MFVWDRFFFEQLLEKEPVPNEQKRGNNEKHKTNNRI